jgi:methyl-accepting chemotaxis protein
LKKVQSVVCLLFCLGVLMSFHSARAQSADKVRILTNEVEGSKLWNNLLQITDYLKAELGVSSEITSAPAVKDLVHEIQNEEYDLVYTSLFFYSLIKNSNLELSPFIGFSDMNGKPLDYYSCIVASKRSGITNLEELKRNGLKVDFKFASPNSSSGHMIPRLQLAVEGIALPEMHFRSVGFSTGHEDVKNEVRSGKIDAAGCSCPEGEENDVINTIWTSPPLMVSFFSTTDHIDIGLKNKLERTFLSFSTNKESDFYKSIVTSYGFEGFSGFSIIDEKPMQSILSSIKEIRDLAFFISYYQDRIKQQQGAIAEGEAILSAQQEKLESQLTFIENQSILLYFAIGGLVVMFIGGIFIYKNYRNRKKLAEELRVRARASESQTLELENQKGLLIEQKTQVEKIMGDTAFIVSKAVNEGNFDSRMEVETKVGEWKTFAMSINEFLNSVTTPYKKVGTIFNEMAKGDLTLRYDEEAKGDIQQLAVSINESLDSLGRLLLAIDDRLGYIKSSSKEMHANSEKSKVNMLAISTSVEEISRGAQNQLQQVDAASGSIELLNKLSGQIKDQSVLVNELAASGDQKSAEGTTLNKSLASRMDRISLLSKETMNSAETLDASMNDIRMILTLMEEIVTQTNLLSLNAAIEAASAGDAGKGFSVVADEIRKLAVQSKKSVLEIDDILNGIQESSNKTLSQMKEVLSTVNQGVEATDKVGIGFESTRNLFKETLEQSQIIKEASEQQFDVVKQVVNQISSIVVVSEETATATKEVASSSNELALALEQYYDKTKQFEDIAGYIASDLMQFKLPEASEKEA